MFKMVDGYWIPATEEEALADIERQLAEEAESEYYDPF